MVTPRHNEKKKGGSASETFQNFHSWPSGLPTCPVDLRAWLIIDYYLDSPRLTSILLLS